MWICSNYAKISKKQIAFLMGERDHSSVVHGIAVVSRKMTEDLGFKKRVESYMIENEHVI